jgi:hypothetical protein
MPRPYHKRRARRIRYKSPVKPPFRYFLNPQETAAALGVSRLTLQRWTKSSLAGNPQGGVEPVILSRRKDGSPSVIRYRWEQVLRYPEGTWLFLLKDDLHRELKREHLANALRRADEAFSATEPEIAVDGDWAGWVQRKAAYVKTWLYDNYEPFGYTTTTNPQENK